MLIKNLDKFNNLLWGPWHELEALQDELTNAMWGWTARGGESATLPVNVWLNPDGAVVTAQVPGLGAEDIEINVEGHTLSITCRPRTEAQDEGSVRRREISGRQRSRALELPFEPDADGVRAQQGHGMLEVYLPRAASDRPRKIQVQSAN